MKYLAQQFKFSRNYLRRPSVLHHIRSLIYVKAYSLCFGGFFIDITFFLFSLRLFLLTLGNLESWCHIVGNWNIRVLRVSLFPYVLLFYSDISYMTVCILSSPYHLKYSELVFILIHYHIFFPFFQLVVLLFAPFHGDVISKPWGDVTFNFPTTILFIIF